MQKIPVAVLGATGAVGQRFVGLLADHPWFEIAALAASERKVGQRYGHVCRWVLPGDPPATIVDMVISPIEPKLPGRIVFSALPAPIALEVEPTFARADYLVCSNASAFRYEPDVPLIIPEVNADHLTLINKQRDERGWPGLIITSPNCTTTGIVMPLKPLDEEFGLQKVFAVTMQAVSGAGHPGIPSLDIIDNIIPYIKGEEEKVERETRLLMGSLEDGNRSEAEITISVSANRVPVLDGHTACLSLGFKSTPSVEQVVSVLADFKKPDLLGELPSAPDHPVVVSLKPDRPQPRRDRDAERGMVVTVGRVRGCSLLDIRLVSVSHNTLRGAASGSVLNAELLLAEGYVEGG
jgi:aspartate-semialdehyde dehydrogenase